MSKEHTKLRLEIGKFWPDPSRTGLLRAEITEVGELAILAHVFAPKGRPAEQEGKDNARRLVAAWNACSGIETETLEADPFNNVVLHFTEMHLAQARADAAEALLREIMEVPVHGPHLSARDGFEAALRTIDIIRGKARSFLAEIAPKPVRLGDEGEG